MSCCLMAQIKVDKNLKPYDTKYDLTGKLRSVGSDTLNNLSNLWSESFMKIHPDLKVEIEGKGSSTAIPAQLRMKSDVGPMSRPPKESELDQVKQINPNLKVISLKVAIDAVGVFALKNHPIIKRGLTMAELDAIYSKQRILGHPKAINNWSQLGLKIDHTIKAISRNSASGTYGFFKKIALKKGDYRDTVIEYPGGCNLCAINNLEHIAYSPVGYKTSKLEAIPLAWNDKGPFYSPTMKNSLTGNYPLSRFLYMTITVNPKKAIPTKVIEYLRFIYSKDGQEIVVKDGYYPLPEKLIQQELAKLQH